MSLNLFVIVFFSDLPIFDLLIRRQVSICAFFVGTDREKRIVGLLVRRNPYEPTPCLIRGGVLRAKHSTSVPTTANFRCKYDKSFRAGDS